MNSQPSSEHFTHRCPQCNRPLTCELEQGHSSCWCFELPLAAEPPELSAEALCLCRDCLQARRSERR